MLSLEFRTPLLTMVSHMTQMTRVHRVSAGAGRGRGRTAVSNTLNPHCKVVHARCYSWERSRSGCVTHVSRESRPGWSVVEEGSL